MDPEGMRKGCSVKVTIKTATTMMASSDWTAGRNPGESETGR
jgi:hypothetical protein